VTPATRFGLASVTKMFTAVAVADQVNAGVLSLDDRVVDLLPPGSRPSTLHADVALSHLLLHTSGIADYAEEDEDTPGYVEDYASLWVDRPSYSMLRPIDFLPLFGDRPPYRPPGERWQYSNAGYVLLGIVLEHVTGRAYVDLVQERVFDRAGMTSTGFLRLDEPHPDVAVAYLDPQVPGGPRRTNIYSVPVIGGADGGAMSTPRDLSRFLDRVADGSLMGPLTDEMLDPREDIGEGNRHAYGFFHDDAGAYGHGGGDPGVSCVADRFPADEANLVALCNVEGWLADLYGAVLRTRREAASESGTTTATPILISPPSSTRKIDPPRRRSASWAPRPRVSSRSLQGAATRTTSSSTSPMRSRSPGVRGTSPCDRVRLRRVPAASIGAPKTSAASASAVADCTLTCRCRVPW
jgi:CubicO group peptidase (beta-lactamase class C family)